MSALSCTVLVQLIMSLLCLNNGQIIEHSADDSVYDFDNTAGWRIPRSAPDDRVLREKPCRGRRKDHSFNIEGNGSRRGAQAVNAKTASRMRDEFRHYADWGGNRAIGDGVYGDGRMEAKANLPQRFCWTRMGTESGQEIEAILSRKELERAANDGIFYWGVGNPLGDAPELLAAQEHNPRVVFSIIRTKPSHRDCHPSGVVAWLSAVKGGGRASPLPEFVLVTSRADTQSGLPKSVHFALLCRTHSNLAAMRQSAFEFNVIRNLKSGRPVGYSQVTAVVEVGGELPIGRSSRYRAEIIVDWERPFVTRLSDPVVLKPREVEAIQSAGASGSLDCWRRTLLKLKKELWRRVEQREAPERHTRLVGRLSEKQLIACKAMKNRLYLEKQRTGISVTVSKNAPRDA